MWCFSPDGKKFTILKYPAHGLYLVDLEKEKSFEIFSPDKVEFADVGWNPNGSEFVVSTNTEKSVGIVTRINVESQKKVVDYISISEKISEPQFLHDGDTYIFRLGKKIIGFDLITRSLLDTISEGVEENAKVFVDNTSKKIYVVESSEIQELQVSNHTENTIYSTTNKIIPYKSTISPDKNQLILFQGNGDVLKINLLDSVDRSLIGNNMIRHIEWVNDNKNLIFRDSTYNLENLINDLWMVTKEGGHGGKINIKVPYDYQANGYSLSPLNQLLYMDTNNKIYLQNISIN